MPSKNPAQRLFDIVDNIDAIGAFVAGFDFDAFVLTAELSMPWFVRLRLSPKPRGDCRAICLSSIRRSTGRLSRRLATSSGMSTKRSTKVWFGMPAAMTSLSAEERGRSRVTSSADTASDHRHRITNHQGLLNEGRVSGLLVYDLDSDAGCPSSNELSSYFDL